MASTSGEIDLAEATRRAHVEALRGLADALSRKVYSPRIKLLDLHQVCEATNLGRTTIEELEEQGKFPKSIRPAGERGKKLWRESTLIAWLDANDPNTNYAGGA